MRDFIEELCRRNVFHVGVGDLSELAAHGFALSCRSSNAALESLELVLQIVGGHEHKRSATLRLLE